MVTKAQRKAHARNEFCMEASCDVCADARQYQFHVEGYMDGKKDDEKLPDEAVRCVALFCACHLFSSLAGKVDGQLSSKLTLDVADEFTNYIKHGRK